MYNSLFTNTSIGVVQIGANLNVSYEAESLALFERMTTEPTDIQKTAYNDMIVALKNSGVWDKRDAIWVTGTYLEEYAILNLKADAHNMIAMLSPTFEAGKGFTSNGSTQYLRTQFNLSTDAVKANLNDWGVTIGFQNDSSTTSWDFGAYNNTAQFALSISDTLILPSVKGVSGFNIPQRTTKGIFSLNMIDAVTCNNYINRYKEENTLTGTMLAFPTDELYALGMHYNGSPFVNGTRQLSYLSIGGALSESEAIAESEAVNDFLVSQGTGILPATPDSDLIVLAGQSNAIGYYPEDILPEGWNEEQTGIDIQYIPLTSSVWEKMNPLSNCGYNSIAEPRTDEGWASEQQAAHNLLDDGNNVLVYKNGSTSLSISNWADGYSGTDRLYELRYYLQRLIDKKYYDDYGSLNSYNPIPKSMLWMQGESDAAMSAVDYEAYLRNIISTVRAIVGIDNIQFVMLELPDIMTALTEAHRTKINTIFNTVAGDTANCVVLNPDDITGVEMRADNLHYTAASQLLIGQAWYDVM